VPKEGGWCGGGGGSIACGTGIDAISPAVQRIINLEKSAERGIFRSVRGHRVAQPANLR